MQSKPKDSGLVAHYQTWDWIVPHERDYHGCAVEQLYGPIQTVL